MFFAMRKEFIQGMMINYICLTIYHLIINYLSHNLPSYQPSQIGRNNLPPHDPLPSEEHLPSNFDYAKYLSINLGEMMLDGETDNFIIYHLTIYHLISCEIGEMVGELVELPPILWLGDY